MPKNNKIIDGIEIKGWDNIIHGLREKLKVNQTDLGSMLGVSTNTVSSWESGKRLPNNKLTVWGIIHFMNKKGIKITIPGFTDETKN